MLSKRFWVWCLPAIFYAAFWLRYTPLSGPITQDELNEMLASMEERGMALQTRELMRRFFESDDGRPFIMVNIIDLADDPVELPETGPDADATDLMAHYMEYMWPALIRRASHPVFGGSSVGNSMDLVGIEGAERWDSAALMRYRSRRDLWEISSNPAFRDRHDYKVAALEKTIAFPVSPQLLLGDPRLLLFLLLTTVLGLIDALFLRKR